MNLSNGKLSETFFNKPGVVKGHHRPPKPNYTIEGSVEPQRVVEPWDSPVVVVEVVERPWLLDFASTFTDFGLFTKAIVV